MNSSVHILTKGIAAIGSARRTTGTRWVSKQVVRFGNGRQDRGYPKIRPMKTSQYHLVVQIVQDLPTELSVNQAIFNGHGVDKWRREIV